MGELWKCSYCLHRYDDESEQPIPIKSAGQEKLYCPTCYAEQMNAVAQHMAPATELEEPPAFQKAKVFTSDGMFEQVELDLLERLNRDLVSTGVTEIWDDTESLLFRNFIFKLADVVEAAKLGREVASLDDLRITRGDTGQKGYTVQWDGRNGGRHTVYESTWLGALRAAHSRALNDGDIKT